MKRFDRFAASIDTLTARAPFFVFSIAVVLVWLPTVVFFESVTTWQLFLSVVVDVVTFWLVAIERNSSNRAERSTQEKLNAIAEALSKVLDDDEVCEQLRQAIGLEERVSA